nr:immunoglobulin light chain junction region [Macaca mulatta]MOW02025.1 immunoglobulin light chain junction region [Macaca mulatta]MOW02125.1 immunoglobulin light chain junction region [Macaca mulatta]MOW02152.1 immunoglobulin light chain junction region [Macaca mulatta]MOW02181.1 immunoglobulin light chain junction region [Macaca mulatta]
DYYCAIYHSSAYIF